MSCFDRIYGNADVIGYFEARIRAGNCSHAYLIEAPAGGGKKLFARSFAASLSQAAEPDARDKIQRIFDGSSPDVLMLSREAGKKTIGVDAVRAFLSTLHLTPSELSFKMYIFDEADRITPQAQNALLKSIEEPPRGVYLLLLCENAMSQLATIRSRVQKIPLQVFTEEDLCRYARMHALIPENGEERLHFAVRMAGGSIGRMEELLTGGTDEFEAFSLVKKVIRGQARKDTDISYYEFLRMIAGFCQTREKLDSFLSYLLMAYRDIIRSRLSDDFIPDFFEPEEAQELSMLFTTSSLSASQEAVGRIHNETAYNTNLSLSAATLSMMLWRAV